MINNPFHWKYFPLDANQSCRLSGTNEKYVVEVAQQVLKDCRAQDVLAIDYLYQSYKSKLKGVILNEENDMNTRLQVSAFLGSIGKSFSRQFLIVILTPDEFLPHWHYHLTKHGGLKAEIITEDGQLEEFSRETNMAFLLAFSNLKMLHSLAELDFCSVIVDSLDVVAQKMVLRKLQGEFNIGLTSRNIYTNPDQKLHWTMLNWSNPGFFGKLADFYEIDNENFASFKNSYKTWWFRLTWDFCETFKAYTLNEKSSYQRIIEEWKQTELKDLQNTSEVNNEIIKGKKKKSKSNMDTDEIKSENQAVAAKREKVVFRSRGRKPMKKIEYGVKRKNDQQLKIEEQMDLAFIPKEENSSSSTDTIIYENRSDIFKNCTVPINLPEKQEQEVEDSPTSLESDFLLSLINEPIRKKQKSNEDLNIEINMSESQDTKEMENDDIILGFLSNSQTTGRKIADKVSETILESENCESVIYRTSLKLNKSDCSDEECENIIHSLVGVCKNINDDANCSVNQTSLYQIRNTRADEKKLEELLRETENY